MSLADEITIESPEEKKGSKAKATEAKAANAVVVEAVETPVPSKVRDIQLTSIKDKKLVKTSTGYAYDNVAFEDNTPLYVYALMAETRVPAEERETFDRVKGLLASHAIANGHHKARIHNGVAAWKGGKITVPSIGTEVYLRIIEDALLKNQDIKDFFEEKARIYAVQQLRIVIKALGN